MTKDLTLQLDPLHSRLTREEAIKLPCFGGCGKSWEESQGGWFELETPEHLAPHWHCDECSERRAEQQNSYTKEDCDLRH